MQGNAILDRNIQPYESHIPFLLQFLVRNYSVVSLVTLLKINSLFYIFYTIHHGRYIAGVIAEFCHMTSQFLILDPKEFVYILGTIDMIAILPMVIAEYTE